MSGEVGRKINFLTTAEETADGAEARGAEAETLESFGCCIVADGCLKIPVDPSNSSLKS